MTTHDPLTKAVDDMWKSLMAEKPANNDRLIDNIRKAAKAAEGQRPHDA